MNPWSKAVVPGIFCTLMLCSCSTAPLQPPAPPEIFQDHLFAPTSQRIDAADVMAVSPAMQAFIEGDLSRGMRIGRDRRQVLIDALYSKQKLKLEYDGERTRTAAEAFDARQGNCLSLVLMTAAFARELNISVHYRDVLGDPTWSRSNDFFFLSGHVNLTLGEDLRAIRGTNVSPDGMTVDFVPAEEIRSQRAVEIGEATIIAMFMNNRAAENLDEGQLDAAYAWVREGLRQDPKYLVGYNTLGVIYRRHGNQDAAERAFRYVLAIEPDNTQAMSNLVLLLDGEQRMAEAGVLAARLKALQPDPPFYFFDLGVAAMKAGDYATARDLFKKEVARSAYYHEFHFWLALANYGLGDMKETRRQIALAMENSTTVKSHDIYAAKLAWLNSLKAQH